MIMNMNTAATSRKTLAFNSACTVGGATYLLTAAGLVALDEAAPVSAEVTLGMQDFGTEALKLLPTLYVGVSASTRIGLDVMIEGKTYIYYIRDYDTQLQQQRFDLGRGLRASWYKFRIYNTSGGNFTVADMTAKPQASTRRI